MSQEDQEQAARLEKAQTEQPPLNGNSQAALVQNDVPSSNEDTSHKAEDLVQLENVASEAMSAQQDQPQDNHKLNMDYVSALESRLEMVESMLRQQKAPYLTETEFATMFQRMARSLSFGHSGSFPTPATTTTHSAPSISTAALESQSSGVSETTSASSREQTVSSDLPINAPLAASTKKHVQPPPDPPSQPKEKKPLNDKKAIVQRVPTVEWRRVKPSMEQSWLDVTILTSYEQVETQNSIVQEIDGTHPISDTVLNPSIEGTSRGTTETNRILINSTFLSQLVLSITGDADTTAVMVRPFKFLLKHEEKLRKVIKDWSAMCKEVEEDPAELTFKDLKTKYISVASTIDTLERCRPKESTDKETLSTKKSANVKPAPEALDAGTILARLQEARESFSCLSELLDVDMKYILDTEKMIQDRSIEQIPFQRLWHLFKPGDMIMTQASETSPLRAFCVLHVSGGRRVLTSDPRARSPFAFRKREIGNKGENVLAIAAQLSPLIIDCFYIDYDGNKFGPMPKKIVIPEYKGLKAITSLEAYPIVFANDKDSIRQKLLERGKTYKSLTPWSNRLYQGLALIEKDLREYQEEVNSEIVLDQGAGIDYLRKRNPGFFHFGGGVVAVNTPCDIGELFEEAKCNLNGCNFCTDVQDDGKYDVAARSEFLDSSLLQFATVDELTDKHLMLLSNRMYGYALQDRKWHAFDVATVPPLHRDESMPHKPRSAFDDLVINPGHKSLIQALVGYHTTDSSKSPTGVKGSSQFSMDLVREKGRGLIILLHGVPGVGKTSTAECVASQLDRPLFPITCGDLGTDARSVEARLEDYFMLAQRWGCILLLDEADVFLASRDNDHIQRNGVVSVFLRILEYYVGVLILTTNRVGSFDEAFRSRIHVSLYYPKLSQESTAQIWDMNIMRVKNAKDVSMDVDEAGIKKFYKRHWRNTESKRSRRWNGRQIRNAFQTAIALAKWEYEKQLADDTINPKPSCPQLLPEHFKSVAETSDYFDDYIHDLHGEEGIEDHQDAWGFKAKRDLLRDDTKSGLDYELRRQRKTDSGYGGSAGRRGSRHRRDDKRDYGQYSDDDHYSNGRRNRGSRHQERARSRPKQRRYDGSDYSSDSNGHRNHPSRYDDRARSRSKGRHSSGNNRLSKSDARGNEAKGYQDRPRSRSDNESSAGSDDEQRDQKRRDDGRR